MFPQLVVLSVLGLTWTTVTGLPCAQMFPSQSPPSNVNSVRPSDVALLFSVGLHRHSTELSMALSKLGELMALFNPALVSTLSDEAHPYEPHSKLLEQAKEVSLYLQNNQVVDADRDWKLVLVFAQVNQLCGCEQQQVQSVIKSVVKEVDDALQLLHSQLKRTIVSVALWDEEHNSFNYRMCPCMEMYSEGELTLLKATLIHTLQESLDELLVKKRWYGDRDDFTVTLQDMPFFTDPSSVSSGKRFSESQDPGQTNDKLTVQMWSNLLQPTESPRPDAEDDIGQIVTLPCPTEDQPFLRTEGNSPSYHHSAPSAPIKPLTGTEMPCVDFSASSSTPTSVHELRPADIKVVAAVGDSLTAGNGIASSPSNVIDVLNQYRGLSWCVGGNENLTNVTTLPNILKYFNHNVTGYSTGNGRETSPQAFFNQAVAGATCDDIPKQVRTLVSLMKNDTRINFKSDWKVITIFIGGNDICTHCRNSLYYSVENYARHIRTSLDYLHKQVPRALVNLVEPLHILPLREMHLDTSLKCPTWLVNILCPCVILPKANSKALQKVEEINRGYQRSLQDLVESGKYDTRSDFTVVVQPFFRDIVFPRLPDGRADRSYFSADCFHLSQKAQTQMARNLWNNMLEPLGNKSFTQDFTADVKLKCPTETSPYIRTYNNSDYIYPGTPPTPGPITNWGSDFSCGDLAPSDTVPTSVHALRPADIKVVAALGDSLTAATGAKAKNLLDLSKNYKEVSWSIGGFQTLDTVTTLPNILRKFNPALKGFSKGQASWQKGFNMAVGGAKSSDIPAQAQALIKAMRDNKEVNFEKDWKVVTILVGGNDLCNYCVDQNNLSPTNYSDNIMLSLDMLYKEVPRLLVNVVELLEIELLRTVKKNTLGCSLLQRVGCPCVINPAENSPELDEIKRINHEYQAKIQHLIYGNRYDGRQDFAVVLQPFLQNTFIPQIGEGEADTSFFSLDCFHISERAHAEMAIALWNNMMEPVGRKQAFNNFTYDRSKINCPAEGNPFIFTKLNSLPTSPPVPTTTNQPLQSTAATTATTIFSPTPTLPLPSCPTSIPVWVLVAVGLGCFLGGIFKAWLILSCCRSRKNKTEKSLELKGTGF